jgi:hypothetical protein
MLSARFIATFLLALAVVIGVGPSARAANQLYQGSWVADSFGNDLTGGTDESQWFSAFAMPQGILCNPGQPRCPAASTPVSTLGGNFSALGTQCTPVAAWKASRPAKGATACATTPMGGCIPFPQTPRYRNPFFFTVGGAPKATSCTATSTTLQTMPGLPTKGGGPGPVQVGNPVVGSGIAGLTPMTGAQAGFKLNPMPGLSVTTNLDGFGMRRTTLGEFNNIFPYVYSYTYATLRNATGTFFQGGGPGPFTVVYKQGANTVAQAVAKHRTAGANAGNQFGGVMRLLGQLTTKVCYFRNGGCSLGENNWRYDAIGTSAYTSAGMVTKGYLALYSAMYYHTALMQASTIMVVGSRFPWTTGSVTVTATGRGPHKTVVRRAGYDSRTALGKGTIQLVTPILTRWLQPAANFETGGIGILNLQFVPEPGKWMLLVAGLSTLGILYRARGR